MEDISQARPVTKDTSRGIRVYLWAHTNHYIIYLQDKNGDENCQTATVYAVNLENNDSQGHHTPKWRPSKSPGGQL